jgi:hypothetical protein
MQAAAMGQPAGRWSQHGSCRGCRQARIKAPTHLTLLQPLLRQSPGLAIRPGCRPGSADTATSSPASPVLGLPTPHLLHCSRRWKLQRGAAEAGRCREKAHGELSAQAATLGLCL